MEYFVWVLCQSAHWEFFPHTSTLWFSDHSFFRNWDDLFCENNLTYSSHGTVWPQLLTHHGSKCENFLELCAFKPHPRVSSLLYLWVTIWLCWVSPLDHAWQASVSKHQRQLCGFHFNLESACATFPQYFLYVFQLHLWCLMLLLRMEFLGMLYRYWVYTDT